MWIFLEKIKKKQNNKFILNSQQRLRSKKQYIY